MDMQEIIIGSANPHKQQKLSDIVSAFYKPTCIPDLETIPERGSTFKEIAENKALDYSKKYQSLVISTDGGAIIPSLSSWEPIKTRRFGTTDIERIEKLLSLMKGKADRTIEWQEAIAIAENGNILFSTTADAMPGIVADTFDPNKYREGIWFCSITNFPQFDNKNYFDLSSTQQEAVEDSWSKLKSATHDFFKNK